MNLVENLCPPGIVDTLTKILNQKCGCLGIVEHQDPLQYLTDYISKKVKYEKPFIKLLILAMVSAYTPNPLNIGIEGPPSEGKTYPPEIISKLFPKEDVIVLAAATPASFTRENGITIDKDTRENLEPRIQEIREEMITADTERKKTLKFELSNILSNAINLVELHGKIILLLESPQKETLAMLRPVLSHDQWEITYKFAKPKASGDWIASETVLRGWPVFIYATAETREDNIWDQIRSLFIVVSPTMNKKKYAAANKMMGKKASSLPNISKLNEDKKELENCRDYIKLVKKELYQAFKIVGANFKGNISPEDINFTWCPFCDALSDVFPSDQGQHMRDFKVLLSLLNSSAYFNIFQRPFMEIDGHPIWLVNGYDLKNVVEIFSNFHFLHKLGDLPIDIHNNVILELDKEKMIEDINGNMGYKLADIKTGIRDSGYKFNEKQVRHDILERLVNAGFLNYSKSKDDGRVSVYTVNNVDVTEPIFSSIEWTVEDIKKAYTKFQDNGGDSRNSKKIEVDSSKHKHNGFYNNKTNKYITQDSFFEMYNLPPLIKKHQKTPEFTHKTQEVVKNTGKEQTKFFTKKNDKYTSSNKESSIKNIGNSGGDLEARMMADDQSAYDEMGPYLLKLKNMPPDERDLIYDEIRKVIREKANDGEASIDDVSMVVAGKIHKDQTLVKLVINEMIKNDELQSPSDDLQLVKLVR